MRRLREQLGQGICRAHIRRPPPSRLLPRWVDVHQFDEAFQILHLQKAVDCQFLRELSSLQGDQRCAILMELDFLQALDRPYVPWPTETSAMGTPCLLLAGLYAWHRQ